VSVDLHNRVLSGNEFQTDGAATEKARRAVSVLVLGTDSRGANSQSKTAGLSGSPSMSHILKLWALSLSLPWSKTLFLPL